MFLSLRRYGKELAHSNNLTVGRLQSLEATHASLKEEASLLRKETNQAKKAMAAAEGDNRNIAELVKDLKVRLCWVGVMCHIYYIIHTYTHTQVVFFGWL